MYEDSKKIDNNKYVEENKKIDIVLDETINAVSEGRKEVFKLYESSRMELYHMELELAKTKNLIKRIITEIDELEKMEKSSRKLYIAISKEPEKFEKSEINRVFDDVNKYQRELSQNRALEKTLLIKRTSLEFHIKSLKGILSRTESLTSKMGTALDYLSGDLLKEINDAKISKTLGLEILRAQEEERRRISREIHDGPAQRIASLVMQVDYCNKFIDTDSAVAKEELDKLKNSIRDGVRDIRRIIFDLMPMSLEDLGLIPTLAHYVDQLTKTTDIAIEFDYQKNDEIKVPNVVKLSAFRIIQEALNNVIKHSNADTAEVVVNIGDDGIEITVIDNGVGIDWSLKSELKTDSGFGLYGIRERVRLLGGELDILSNKGNISGCKIVAKLPLL